MNTINARRAGLRLWLRVIPIAACLVAASPTSAQPSGSDAPNLSASSPAQVQALPQKVETGQIDTVRDPATDTRVDAAADPATLPRDLSPWGMYLHADWIVKAVLIGLAIASIVNLTVLLAKSFELLRARRRQRRALDAVTRAGSLAAASASLESEPKRHSTATELIHAAASELTLSSDALEDREGLKERIASRLGRIEAASSRRISAGTGILATIGGTAPFVGLFGTVWGIMSSFIGISEAQTTNLAVIAPGIAEALLATAMGLVAAIPAVIIYNHFARRIAGYKALVADTSAAVLGLVSRDLSRGLASEGHRRVGAE